MNVKLIQLLKSLNDIELELMEIIKPTDQQAWTIIFRNIESVRKVVKRKIDS